MKLVIAIISNDDRLVVNSNLHKKGFFVTILPTTGGYLGKSNSTLLIGTEDEQVNEVIDTIKQFSTSRIERIPESVMEVAGYNLANKEVKIGGATIFVVDLKEMIKI